MDILFEMELFFASRTRLLKIMNELTEEQLLFIPKGFNNNILWHVGHCVVSFQRLIYLRSGLPLHISEEYMENFKIGSSPATWKTKPDIEEVKRSIVMTAEKFKQDLANNIFLQFEPFKPSMGIQISNHLQAFAYANFHEAEHTGSILFFKTIQQDPGFKTKG